ncbi:MAG: hypothetical protein IJ552_02395 [Prevotella sp.]|nr:hypothetical protein [Prevotella sp.]
MNNELFVTIDDNIPIPLGKKTNFGNLTLKIIRTQNYNGSVFLFSMNSSSTLSNKVSKKDVDSGLFHHIDELKDGMKIVHLKDTHFWTTVYYSGNKYREDVLLVKDGQALNSVIAPYDTNGTMLECRYCSTDDSEKWVKNLTLSRPLDPGENNVTNLVMVQYQNLVLLENITVNFYKNNNNNIVSLGNDTCFNINHSTNISFKNVTINGTYSRIDGYGYGMVLNNVWNSKFENLVAHGNWGVFGNYNLNYAYLKNCTLNRLDLHAYGKDIICEYCTFEKDPDSPDSTTHIYNRFDGLYGMLLYKNCTFNDFYPVRIDNDFKLFTGFDCIIEGGVINIGPHAKSLVSILKITNADLSTRPENTGVSWPNIIMRNVTLNKSSLVSGLCPYALFEVPNPNNYTYSGVIDYITIINLYFLNIGNNIYIKEFHTDVDASFVITRNLDSSLTVITGNQTPTAGSYVKRIY